MKLELVSLKEQKRGLPTFIFIADTGSDFLKKLSNFSKRRKNPLPTTKNDQKKYPIFVNYPQKHTNKKLASSAASKIPLHFSKLIGQS